MVESPAQDVTVRTHLFPGGTGARGAVFVGRLGAFRYEASRDPETGWVITFAAEPEIPPGLHEHLVAAALSAIGVAEGLFRQPPPPILSVRPEDLESEAVELEVDVRDVFEEAGIAQGFVAIPGKGRFTFQADLQPDGEWSVAFGIDLPLPEDVALRLERTVRTRIEQILQGNQRR